ncbi:MAG: hypothetical protein ACRDVP_02415, partial [Acidimicrobiales bacterium]
AEVHTVCGVLVVDAQAANGELPTPDSQFTHLLSSAYTSAYEAGNDCYSSAAGDAVLTARARSEIAQSLAQLARALERFEQLAAKSLSTTTTTQPAVGGLFG